MQRWEKGSRYYFVEFGSDLLGDWVVTKAWGQIGSRLGGKRNIFVPDRESGLREIRQIAERRARRGYRIVQPCVW